MPYIHDGLIEAPIYIYRLSVRDAREQRVKNMHMFEDFLIRRIQDDGYVPECFDFGEDYVNGYHRLVACPHKFHSFWAQERDDEGWCSAYG